MRTRRPLKRLLGAAALAAGLFLLSPSAEASDRWVKDVADQLTADIGTLEELPERTKALNRQLGAFRKAHGYLIEPADNRTGLAGQLRRATRLVGKWLKEGEPLTDAVNQSLGALQANLQNEADDLGGKVGDIEKKRPRKKAGRNLKQAKSRLQQAAGAEAAGKPKKQSTQLLKISRLLDKTGNIVDANPASPTGNGGGAKPFVYIAKDSNGVKQVFVTDEEAPEGEIGTPHQISNGTQGAFGAQFGVVEGQNIAVYYQDGALWVVDLDDLEAGPLNMTSSFPGLSGVQLEVDAKQGLTIVKESATQNMLLVDLVNRQTHDLGVQSGQAKFFNDGFILKSFEFMPFAGQRLDLYRMGENGPECTPLAGPSVDGTNAYAPTLDIEGEHLAYLCALFGERNVKLCVTKLSNVAPFEVNGDVSPMLSRFFENVGGWWVGSGDAPTLVYQPRGGKPASARIDPTWASAVFEQPVQIDHDRPLNRLHGTFDDSLVVSDEGYALFRYRLGGSLTALTDPQSDELVSAFAPKSQRLAYLLPNEFGRVELHEYDPATSSDNVIHESEGAVSRVRALQIHEVDETQALYSYQAAEQDQYSTLVLGSVNWIFGQQPRPAEITARDVSESLIAHLVTLVGEIEEDEVIFHVASFFRTSPVTPGRVDLGSGGFTKNGVRLGGTPRPSILGAEALALPFLARGN